MVTSTRLRLPGLVSPESGLETYWVRPGGVTAVRVDEGDTITVIDRAGRQAAEVTVLGDPSALGITPDAPASTLRSLPAAPAGDGRDAVLAALAGAGTDAMAARLFGE